MNGLCEKNLRNIIKFVPPNRKKAVEDISLTEHNLHERKQRNSFPEWGNIPVEFKKSGTKTLYKQVSKLFQVCVNGRTLCRINSKYSNVRL